jgi:peptidoglycan/LPS O-acetylase OafA/YrhL
MHSSCSEGRAIPKHFYSLDVLRGAGALAVVLWHWQHFFFYRTADSTPFVSTQQPFYTLLQAFYTDGWRAVELFFSLSGFIFFWLYSEKIQTRNTSTKEFFLLRFSRLYPLHCITLLIVAAGQQYMRRRFGSDFTYQNNDLYHFALQTVFASNWGVEKGLSFNGPIWSVSVEMLCYTVFFLICRLNLSRWWCLVALSCCACFIKKHGLSYVGSGLLFFFAGGLSFQIFTQLVRYKRSKAALCGISAIAALLWILKIAAILHRTPSRAYDLLLFPITILALALWEVHRGTLGKRLALLGHISYSSYLLQFPLQLFFVAIAAALSIKDSFFYTPLSLGLFFATLIPLSLLSYSYFERPSQSLIRRWALRKSPLASAATKPSLNVISGV